MKPSETSSVYDAIIVGSGTSGSFLADSLTRQGLDCLLLEAGKFFHRETYPSKAIDANSQLFWSGGIELNTDANLGLLRPKCVGGGSIVNQALMDRFDEEAFRSWRRESEVSFFNLDEMEPWYERAESKLSLQSVPSEYQNRNAEIFREGCEKNGFGYHELRRAQRNCYYEDGNDCIECLNGCPVDSKQSTPVTVLHDALEDGLDLLPEFEVKRIYEQNNTGYVLGRHREGPPKEFKGKFVILAAGAIGNSKILLESDLSDDYPSAGKNFYSHPQRMVFGLYDEPVRSYKGGFQSLASDDSDFREKGFKLENVFGHPSDLAMLFPGFGASHQEYMKQINHYACVEVAVRDTIPGRIFLNDNGDVEIKKPIKGEDKRRRERGVNAIKKIFQSTGVKRIIEGKPHVGFHLMGGCNMGTDPAESVTSPAFHLHGSSTLFAADSSVFPNAPGINPALTIMALSLKAGETIVEEHG